MTPFRTVLVSSGLVLAFFGGTVQAQQNARATGKMVTVQMPATPDPARVTLDPKTTALIVLDYVEPICNAQPSCKDKMLPAMTPFMDRVRKAGLTVAYGTRAQNMSKWLKRGRADSGGHQDRQHRPGPVLQHRSGQGPEGKGHHDADYGRLEDQRFGDLHVGRSDGARLHGRHSGGYDVGRQRLRDDHRLL